MRRVDLLTGFVLVAFAALYFERTFHITIGLASDRLGPTFFPRLLAALLALCGLGLLFRAAAGRSDSPRPAPMRLGLFVAIITLALGYLVALPVIGFVVLTPLLLGAVMALLGLRNWWALAGTSIGITLLLLLVFVEMLRVPLPMGLFGER